MNRKEFSTEGESYTKVTNSFLDAVVKTPLLGAELAIVLFVVRKTDGYGKVSDRISLSQFMEGTGRSRPTIVKGLKNLQLVNILQLVKVGCSKSSGSEWKLNKDKAKWIFGSELVNTPQLVKDRRATSKEKLLKLVNTPLHTKDNTKETIQKKVANSVRGVKKKVVKKKIVTEYFLKGNQWNYLFDAFSPVNPMYREFYKNTTERAALDEMAKTPEIGYDKLLFLITNLEEYTSKPYAPKITTPCELKREMGKLVTFWKQEKERVKQLQKKETNQEREILL